MLTSPMDALLCSGASTPAIMAHRCRLGASTPSLTLILTLALIFLRDAGFGSALRRPWWLLTDGVLGPF